MKSIIYLLLALSASALPQAVVLPLPEIQARAQTWLRANPSGVVKGMTTQKEFGAGQSMRPLLQPCDRMFYEAYVGQKVKGEVVLVSVSWCKIPVTHLAYDETKTHIFLTGINNRKSDGWIPKTALRGVLVGVLRPE